jgi:hypothetical protein
LPPLLPDEKKEITSNIIYLEVLWRQETIAPCHSGGGQNSLIALLHIWGISVSLHSSPCHSGGILPRKDDEESRGGGVAFSPHHLFLACVKILLPLVVLSLYDIIVINGGFSRFDATLEKRTKFTERIVARR